MFSRLDQWGEPLSTPRPISDGGFLGHPVVGLSLSELDQADRLSRQRGSCAQLGLAELGTPTAALETEFAFLAAERRWTGSLRKGWNRPLSDLVLPQALPQGVFWPILRSPKTRKPA
jgi:hypothetical protein